MFVYKRLFFLVLSTEHVNMRNQLRVVIGVIMAVAMNVWIASWVNTLKPINSCMSINDSIAVRSSHGSCQKKITRILITSRGINTYTLPFVIHYGFSRCTSHSCCVFLKMLGRVISSILRPTDIYLFGSIDKRLKYRRFRKWVPVLHHKDVLQTHVQFRTKVNYRRVLLYGVRVQDYSSYRFP